MTAAEVVDACGARRRLRALTALGWPGEHLQEALPGIDVDDLIHAAATTITADTHRRICALYEQLSMTVGPCTASRDHAAAQHWPPPLGWDDDHIDDTDAKPAQWRPPAPAGSCAARPLVERYNELHARGLDQRQIIAALDTSARSIINALRRHNQPIDPALAAVQAAARRHRRSAQRRHAAETQSGAKDLIVVPAHAARAQR
jgi:hypothetical protein